MQAIPHMIISGGILNALDAAQIIPVDANGRFISKTQTVSIVELGKRLLKAARDGDTSQVRDLMSKGAPFTTDWLGTSPLHFAALNNHLETCQVLLRAGISRDSRTKVDRTPLHMASYEGHLSVVDLLLTNGAEVDAKDMLKMTPLHWAVQNGHEDVVALLLRNGANTTLINKFDKSPLDIAIEINRIDILQLLQMITKDILDPTESLSIEINTQDMNQEEDIKSQIIHEKHFLDPDDVEENDSLTEKLDTVHTKVQQENNVTNVDLTDSIQMLKEHGISFLPADNSNVVATAVENGHSLVLTEVGKQVLNSTKPIISRASVQKPTVQKIKSRQLIALTPEQLLAMASPSNNSNRIPIVINNTDKSQKRVVMNKNKIIFSGIPNLTNVTKRVKIDPQMLKKASSSSLTDIEVITRQLAEARREAEEYKQMLKRKEAEAEKYKRQLQSITQAK